MTDEEPDTDSRILRGPDKDTERDEDTALETGMLGVDTEGVEEEGVGGREEKSDG